MFFINEGELYTNEEELDIKVISEYIELFQAKYQSKLKMLEEKYNRELSEEVVVNLQKYIVDTVTSYTFGEPIQYSNVSEDYIDNMTEIDEDSHNILLAKDMAIFGRAYEFIFVDEDTDNVQLINLSPINTFIIYSDDIIPRPLVGVHFYGNFDRNGAIVGYTILCYTPFTQYKFVGQNLDSLSIEVESDNYFGAVNILEVKNNPEMKSDFADVNGLITKYEELMSDRIDDKNSFVNKLLVITNSSLGDTQEEFEESKRILRNGGILELENDGDGSGATAQFISQSFNEADVEILRKALLDDIFRQAKIPNLSDESFGNASSGISLRFKLYGTEMLASEKERNFKKHIRARLKIINNLYTLQSKGMDLSDIDITMVRTIPVGLDERLQELQATDGILSLETRLARYDSEIDVKEEIKKLQEEKENNMQLMQNSFGNYHYNQTTEINEDTDNEDEDN